MRDLICRFVLCDEQQTEEDFLKGVSKELNLHGVSIKKAICGKNKSLMIDGKNKFTRSLMIADLSKENSNYENSIEINALSKFKFLNLFEEIAFKNNSPIAKEIWINTSEAEILPALNPSYEISKSLIGQLVSFKKNLLNNHEKKKLKIKKIILGPFKSELNPIGIMSAEFVSKNIYNFANLNIFLIIISPNPLSYILFPIKELYFFLYCKFLNIAKINN